MGKSLNSFVANLKIYFLFLFVFSGLLKWIPFPVDLTLFFGMICSLVLIKDVFSSRNIFYNKKIINPIMVFCLFCLWYLFTALYTKSDSFWIEKSKSIVLLVISFFYPIYSLRYYSFLKILKNFLIFSSIGLLILLYLEYNNLLYLITSSSDEFRNEKSIPDYISISEMLSCGFLVSFLFKSKIMLLYRFLVIFMIILLGARAPVLLLGLFYVLYFIITKKWGVFKFKNILAFIIIIISLSNVFFYWDGAKNLRERLTSLESFKEDESAAARVRIMTESLDFIYSKPFLGTGIGGAGIELTGNDENVYPHNHFIETFLESGFLGFLLITVFWFLIFSKFRFNISDKIHLILSIVILILFFNYMKSGSYLDIRKMFVWVGILLAYVNYVSYRKDYITI
jgi:O-antigen ligase